MNPQSPKRRAMDHPVATCADTPRLLVPGFFFLLVYMAGCSLLPAAGRGHSVGSATGPGWKVVAEKVEPSYLIATDRAECYVSEERFEEVEPGDRVFCAWSHGGSGAASVVVEPRRPGDYVAIPRPLRRPTDPRPPLPPRP